MPSTDSHTLRERVSGRVRAASSFTLYDRTVELREVAAVASTVEIAPQAETDLAQLFVLAGTVFADLPGWSDERVLDVLRGDVVFVARERGQLAGFVALSAEQEDAIVIEQMLVAPGHEQRGVGHSLLAYAEGYAIAERARSLQIVVEANNQPARNFYRRSGFVPVESEPELFELVLPAGP
jgi:ribosomal protein S18 acetylase RimI-like enzyme